MKGPPSSQSAPTARRLARSSSEGVNPDHARGDGQLAAVSEEPSSSTVISDMERQALTIDHVKLPSSRVGAVRQAAPAMSASSDDLRKVDAPPVMVERPTSASPSREQHSPVEAETTAGATASDGVLEGKDGSLSNSRVFNAASGTAATEPERGPVADVVEHQPELDSTPMEPGQSEPDEPEEAEASPPIENTDTIDNAGISETEGAASARGDAMPLGTQPEVDERPAAAVPNPESPRSIQDPHDAESTLRIEEPVPVVEVGHVSASGPAKQHMDNAAIQDAHLVAAAPAPAAPANRAATAAEPAATTQQSAPQADSTTDRTSRRAVDASKRTSAADEPVSTVRSSRAVESEGSGAAGRGVVARPVSKAASEKPATETPVSRSVANDPAKGEPVEPSGGSIGMVADMLGTPGGFGSPMAAKDGPYAHLLANFGHYSAAYLVLVTLWLAIRASYNFTGILPALPVLVVFWALQLPGGISGFAPVEHRNIVELAQGPILVFLVVLILFKCPAVAAGVVQVGTVILCHALLRVRASEGASAIKVKAS